MKKSLPVRSVITIIVLLFINLLTLSAQGFLHRNGKYIYDGEGNEIILRGHSPGGWLLQEGYMLQMEAFANAQYQIRAKIEELIGPEQTDLFYEKWYENHFTRADFDLLVDMGFNSIRLPLHYNLFTLPIEDEPVEGENTWLEKGFAIVDTLLAWCTERGIYLILDMHAAPGGQGRDAAISDYNPAKPSLWQSELNKEKLVALWKQLALRYANEPWIGGYDLINEPNWNFTGSNQNGCDETTNAPMRELYIRITEAIREVDTNHIIFIEGNCWGNNHNGLTPPWDDNLVYSFHKYWSANGTGSIQWMINLRNAHNVPIWMGEAGENSNHWYADAVRLFEQNNIGWAWWTWKKFGSFSGIASIQPPDGYQTLKNYWQNGGTKPTAEFATGVLMELTERLKLENCIINYPVADALLRQPTEGTAIPFAQHTIPEIVFATDFDMGQNGVAYLDAVFQNTHVSSGEYTAWNTGWGYRNDGVDIQTCTDTDNNNGFNVGWTETGEWMQYTIVSDSTAAYTLGIRSASGAGGSRVRIESEGLTITPVINLPSTSGWQTWLTTEIPGIILEKGTHKVRFIFEQGGSNLNYFKFSNPVDIAEIPFNGLYAETSVDGMSINLTLNKQITSDIGLVDLSDFSVTNNNEAVQIASIALSDGDQKMIQIEVEEPLFYGGTIRLTYSGTNINSSEQQLELFANLLVKNNLPVRFTLPVRIQAEDYSFNNGMVSEACSDTGGGLNMGHANPGDYMDYYVYVPNAGYYNINVRVATIRNSSELVFRIGEGNTFTDVGNLIITSTGGWQTWVTRTVMVFLPEGRYTMRLFIRSGEFNINWFQPIVSSLVGINDSEVQEIRLYPNPASEYIILELPGLNIIPDQISIYNTMGQAVKSILPSSADNFRINVSDLKQGLYIVVVKKGNQLISTKKLLIR